MKINFDKETQTTIDSFLEKKEPSYEMLQLSSGPNAAGSFRKIDSSVDVEKEVSEIITNLFKALSGAS